MSQNESDDPVNVKTVRTIAHIFVAFSEKLNFIYSMQNVFVWDIKVI